MFIVLLSAVGHPLCISIVMFKEETEFLKEEIRNIMTDMIRLIDKRSALQQESEVSIDLPPYCDYD